MADRTVATTNTLNYFRHEYNATAIDVGSIQSILDATGFIASSTDVVEAIVAINTELPEITTDAFVFPTGTMTFEGATDDAYETTWSMTDPTADRTYTFPDANGDVVLADSTDTSSSKTLTSPTINAGALTGAFTGTMDITGTVLSGASPLVFEGATADEYETTLTITDPTADRTVTMPNATDTLIGKATTDTLSNKSFDFGGSGNSITGSLAEWNTALQSNSFTSLTGTETLTNKTLTSPTINTPTITSLTATALNLTDASIIFEGATADDFETTLTVVDPTADRTITIPNETGTLITSASAATNAFSISIAAALG